VWRVLSRTPGESAALDKPPKNRLQRTVRCTARR
jgi:hypothetical protein